MERLLDIKGLYVTYRDHRTEVEILSGVDLQVYKGKVTALVGESGSGKTTLVMSVMGLLQKNADVRIKGEILFEGNDLLKFDEKRMSAVRGKEIGMIFQEPLLALHPSMSAGEQVEEVLKLKGCKDTDKIRSLTLKIMADAGLPDPASIYPLLPSHLSGGLRQRVTIAMALAGSPKMIIADEPTTALDVTTQAQILALLKDLRRESDLSMILITHDLGVVAEMADTAAVMYCGKVMEYGPVSRILKESAHPYTLGLIRCIPSIGSREGTLYTIPGLIPEPASKPRHGCVFQSRCFMKKKDCEENDGGLIPVDDLHSTRCPYWKELNK